MSVATGANTVWVWVWEDLNEYNQEPGEPEDDIFKVFGSNESVSSQDRSNNPERMYRPFDRATAEIIETAFEGSWGVDFTLTNPEWIPFVYGNPDVEEDDQENEFTWTFDLAPRAPPRSAHLIEEIHYPDGEIEQTIYTGAFAGSADVDVSVEDVVDISLDGMYATEETYSTAVGDQLVYGDDENGINEQPETEYRPLHFGNSVLRVDLDEDGSPELKSLVQDASLTLEGNPEMEYELGTRFGGAFSNLAFEPDLTYTNLVGLDIKDEEKKNAYGTQDSRGPEETMDEAAVEAELEIASGRDGDPEFLFDIIGAFPSDFDRANVGDPQESIEDNIDRMVEDVDITIVTDRNPLDPDNFDQE